MTSQTFYTTIFWLLAFLQAGCAFLAFRSEKSIGKHTGWLNLALIAPIVSNIAITDSHSFDVSRLGYYASYIGMTCVMIAVVNFTVSYCQKESGLRYKGLILMYVIGVFDIVQILSGFIFDHVFSMETVMLDGLPFIADVPKYGLTIHRVLSYVMYSYALVILIINIAKTAKLYREKFVVILITLLAAGIAQFMFIFSRTPIDKSVILHGIFGLVVYYFSIHYRPLKLLDAVLSTVASDMNDAVYVFDADNKCVWANDPGYKLIGVPAGKTGLVKAALFQMFGDFSDKGKAWADDIYIPSVHGYYILERKAVETSRLQNGSFLVIKDSTERHRALEKELYASTHDGLTGLHNMRYLYQCIEDILKKESAEYCVLYLNLKNFKIVNDIFGKKFGDKVLVELAQWIKTNLTDERILYGRLIGDTFGIFMPIELFNEDMFLKDLANFSVDNQVHHQICIHTGVYFISDPTVEVSVLFDRAHLALNNITGNYKTYVAYYNDELRRSLIEEQQLVSDLNEALANDQIKAYLQPIADVNGVVVGAEALARWEHPSLGFLSPSKFIPMFEKNGMIIEVDKHIWEYVCKILRRWKGVYDNLFISFNVSPKDFYYIDVVDVIKGLVARYEIDPAKLRIEITETAMMSDPEEKIKIFNALRNAGFVVEMDDFGSGYSSLNLLKDMPVDVLKIDMAFLSSEENDKSETIIRNVLNLSNDLKITALTEGVETKQQYAQLVDLGCSLFQGYYFAKPMSAEDFDKFIEARSSDPGSK